MADADVRITGILARGADVAVVFRHGARDLTQCLRWDLARDEVVPGQWIRGTVLVQRCDVSPDGELLVGAFTDTSPARQGRRARGDDLAYDAWTAVSRIPYFTALRVWPAWGEEGGGGVWIERRRLGLNAPWLREVKEARGTIRVELAGGSETEVAAVFAPRLRLAGWSEIRALGPTQPTREIANDQPPSEGLWTKSFPGGELRRRVLADREIWELRDGTGAVRREFRPGSQNAPLLDIDHRGRVIYGDSGRLWAWAEFPDGEPTMIADLNANAFEAVAPPDWAREWPT